MTQYKTKSTRQGYSGYSDDELASRLSAVLETKEIENQVRSDFEQSHPKTFSKPETMTQSEWDNLQKTNKFIADNPLSNLPNDKKFEVMQAQYQKDLIEDTKRRAEAGEVIEAQTQRELIAIGIDPSTYIYSKEFERIEEGNEE